MTRWTSELVASHRQLLVCGDLNVARTEADVHPNHRGPNVVGQTARERERFEAILATGLVDLGQQLASTSGPEFTWWPPWREEKAKDRGWRIDYALATGALAACARSFRVLRDIGTSDHAPLVIDLDLDPMRT
jgi:exodeoxyribonuclease-3